MLIPKVYPAHLVRRYLDVHGLDKYTIFVEIAASLTHANPEPVEWKYEPYPKYSMS